MLCTKQLATPPPPSNFHLQQFCYTNCIVRSARCNSLSKGNCPAEHICPVIICPESVTHVSICPFPPGLQSSALSLLNQKLLHLTKCISSLFLRFTLWLAALLMQVPLIDWPDVNILKNLQVQTSTQRKHPCEYDARLRRKISGAFCEVYQKSVTEERSPQEHKMRNLLKCHWKVNVSS